MKTLSLLSIVIILSLNTYGQKKGYYKVNNKIVDTVRIQKTNDYFNSTACRILEENGKRRFLFPDQIDEYGFDDGRVFVSKEVKKGDSIQKVFFEKINFKEQIFYFFKKSKKTGDQIFFLEQKDGSLKEVPQKSNIEGELAYKDVLREVTKDCPALEDEIKIIKYNRPHISLLANQYERCKSAPLPFIKYGLTAGYSIRELAHSAPEGYGDENISVMKMKSEGGFKMGGFIDVPINYTDFSIHAELYYAKHSYSFDNTAPGVNVGSIDSYYYFLNLHSLNAPVSFRYSFPYTKVRPFVNIGLVYSYYINWDDNIYLATQYTNREKEPIYTYVYARNELPVHSDHQLHYSIGGGVEYRLTSKRSVFLNIGYTRQLNIEMFKGLSDKSHIKNKSSIEFSTSINI